METVEAFRKAAAEDAKEEEKNGEFIRFENHTEVSRRQFELLGPHATRVDWEDPGLIYILEEFTKGGMWNTVI
jgi:hypothetical protein